MGKRRNRNERDREDLHFSIEHVAYFEAGGGAVRQASPTTGGGIVLPEC